MIDTRQKRMSAMNPASPWRGPMVDATEAGFGGGNRQAANFMYSGILAAVAAVFMSANNAAYIGFRDKRAIVEFRDKRAVADVNN